MMVRFREQGPRRWCAGLLAAALLTVGACSSAGTELDSTGSGADTTGSVTQSAPTVWATPTDSDGTPSSTPADATDESTILPGLTADCSAAIRGHALMADLLRLALEPAAQTADEETVTAVSTEEADGDTSVDATSALTQADVDDTFAQLTDIPTQLAPSFAALREAATEAIGKPVGDIPDLLTAPEVDQARESINKYITDCQPPSGGGD